MSTKNNQKKMSTKNNQSKKIIIKNDQNHFNQKQKNCQSRTIKKCQTKQSNQSPHSTTVEAIHKEMLCRQHLEAIKYDILLLVSDSFDWAARYLLSTALAD